MARVDLNSDLGESFGRYSLGLDDQVIPLVTSVNVACGMHAGDPCVLRRTVAAADCLVPAIGEIVGGSQREERLDVLLERMGNAA